jgi:hypothetical protein
MKLYVKKYEKKQLDGSIKSYYSVDKVNKMKLFDTELELVYAKEVTSKLGKSALMLVSIPEGMKPIIKDEDGKEKEAMDCTTVSFFLPIKVDKSGKEYGSGFDALKIFRESATDEAKPRIILTAEEATNKAGMHYSKFKVRKA